MIKELDQNEEFVALQEILADAEDVSTYAPPNKRSMTRRPSH